MVTVVDTDMADTEDTDTTEENAPLMPPLMLKLKPKLSHGTDMDTALIHMLMVDTDTHTLMEVITTLVRDLLMPNPTMAMEVMVDTDMAVMTVMAVVMAITDKKPSSYII